MKDWLMELCPEIAEWQADTIIEQVRIRVKSEREACAKVCFDAGLACEMRQGADLCFELSEAIRARGET